ncbi:MAG TPA: DUF6364 family protein [Candidatus Acidoferrales bacterium]|nr:DUF6364 family protein [Candidatus Acidoferrales bacterium]
MGRPVATNAVDTYISLKNTCVVKVATEMKTKLTLTIEEKLIPQAKRYAEAKRVSLSGLVEKALENLTQPKETPFSTRWRGKFKTSRRSSARYKALSRRYL